MRKLFAKCWNDDDGALIATEFLFVATILVIGTVIGLTAVRNAVNAELTDLANAILALDLSYTISGVSGCGASVNGTQVIDIIQQETCPTSVAPTPTIIGCPPCN
jgi:Flp pilus assembly pilin Flp